MQVIEKTREEIEKRANSMSDFLRMEYLESVSKKFNDVEILRFCFKELSRLYESRKMYPESVKYISKFQEVCLTSREKNEAYIKEAEILISGGFYDRAGSAIKKAVEASNEKERFEIKRKIIEFYKKEAENLEKLGRCAGAMRAYERLVVLLEDAGKIEIKRKLLVLYKKLGKVRESIELEREIARSPIGNAEIQLM